MAVLPTIWQRFQLSDSAAGYLAVLAAIWLCCWLSGSANSYLAVLLAIWQIYLLYGSAAGYLDITAAETVRGCAHIRKLPISGFLYRASSAIHPQWRKTQWGAHCQCFHICGQCKELKVCGKMFRRPRQPSKRRGVFIYFYLFI